MLNAAFLYHELWPSQHLSFLFLPLPELPNQYEHSINFDFCFNFSLPEQLPQQLWDLMPIDHHPISPPPISFQPPFSLFTSPSSFDSSNYLQLPANLSIYCHPSYYHYLLVLLNLFRGLQVEHPVQRLPQLFVTSQTFSFQPLLVQHLREKNGNESTVI